MLSSCVRSLLLFCCFLYCYGDDLVLTQKPSYVVLEDKVDTIHVSDVQHMLSAVFGFTLHKELKFHGLYAASPFKHPKAAAIINLYGGQSVTEQLQGAKLNLKADDVHVSVQSLKHHLHQFFHEDSNVVEINHETKVSDFDGPLGKLSDDRKTVLTVMNEVYRTNVLNLTEPEIDNLMRQASLILQSLRVMKEQGVGHGDLYSYELYIPTLWDAAAQKEVIELVSTHLEKVNTMMVDMYGDDCVVLVVSLPDSSIVKSRKVRSLLATDDEAGDGPDAKDINMAEAWSEDYAAIFNIILWLFVFMALITIFVTYGMMTMDPGNDSIIYRMTTTRLKKD